MRCIVLTIALLCNWPFYCYSFVLTQNNHLQHRKFSFLYYSRYIRLIYLRLIFIFWKRNKNNYPQLIWCQHNCQKYFQWSNISIFFISKMNTNNTQPDDILSESSISINQKTNPIWINIQWIIFILKLKLWTYL